MPGLKSLYIICSFFRHFLISSLISSFICTFILFTYGFGVFSLMVWFKLLIFSLTLYMHDSNRNNEYLYYYNLGISKIEIWVVALCIDIILFILLYISLSYLL